MQKVIFRNCDESSPFWSELEGLFQSEWSDFKFKDTYKDSVQLPPAITVLRDNVVIGGLAYSHFQEPNRHETLCLSHLSIYERIFINA